jgi:hypothetical protein
MPSIPTLQSERKIRLNNLVKNVSHIQIREHTMKTVMDTTTVYLPSSSLVDQDTFFISAETSRKNYIGLKPEDFV